MSTYRYISRELSGNECIGNSLSAINTNFVNLDANLYSLNTTVANIKYVPTIATTLSAGVVRIGQGLTIDSSGILSNNTLVTFASGFLSSSDHLISLNTDNTTITVNASGYITTIPSPQENWVTSNSATLEVLANTASTQIHNVSSLATTTQNAIKALSSEYNYNMHNTLNTVNALVSLLTTKIVTQPLGGVANEPEPYVLFVSATPTNTDFLPMVYSWYYNYHPLSSTNTPVLSVYNPGIYYCYCHNPISTTKSNEVDVSFNQRAKITKQPLSQAYYGSPVALIISSTGTMPYAYQWLLNDTPILSARDAIYYAGGVGDYKCVVSNIVNSVTSDAATIY